MTYKFNNVYVLDTFTIAGYYEKQGPYSKYFDKIYDNDFYFGEKSFEKAEVKLMKDSINFLLEKTNKKESDIDLIIAGDLLNQLTASSYAVKSFKIPFLGVYNACATTAESIIIGSSMIDGGFSKNIICSTSSHNLSSEKQFRNPVEYGGPKPKYATFTSTGGASILLTSEKNDVRVESGTIGEVCDLGVTDINNMGAVMAPAAGEVIFKHLKDTNRDSSYYDLILTGDLGIFGKEILKDYLKEKYEINLGDNYNDCGAMLYDLENQKEITAGGSGTVCSALINYGYVYKTMKGKKLKKVLLVPTGALFSPTFAFQKESILSIAHAVSLEVVE